ncbi:MAG: hypothetical protein Q8L08_08905 [Candidatus Nanopelagicaceae bacterium]|nr:hypothetical protein [Candidatus Nanopelagicaceae bacterium]
MNIRKFKGATIAGSLGAVMIVAHLIFAIAFGLAASQWMSGVAIGLVLVIAASLHVILSKRRQNS